MSGSSSSKPLGLHWRSSTAFILSTITIGMFTDLFLYGLLIPIVPFLLPDRLHTPPDLIQSQTSLLLTAYALSQALLSIPIGIIADRLPTRQTPFLVGLLSLLASTVLLYLGTTFSMLILARILQGFSAGVVWSVGLALVLETVGSERLGITIGSIFGVISTGGLVAPALGGILYDKVGMGSVFGVAFALLGVDLVTRLLVIERKVAEQKYGVDFSSSSSSTIADGDIEDDEVAPLLSPEETESRKKYGDFTISKNRSKIFQQIPILHPLLHPRTVAATILSLTQALVLSTFDATLPLHALSLFNFTSLSSGVLFIPLTLPSLLLGPFTGRLIDTHGTKLPALLGLISIIPPLILLRLPHQALTSGPDQTLQIAMLSLLLTFTSISVSFLGSPGLVESSYVTEQYHTQNEGLFANEGGPFAKLYAVNSMIFSLGLAVGPLVAGWLREMVGFGDMMVVVAVWCAAVGVLCWFYLGGEPRGWRGLWRKKGAGEEEDVVGVDT